MDATPSTCPNRCVRCGRTVTVLIHSPPSTDKGPLCPQCLLNAREHQHVKSILDHDLAELFRYYR